MRSDAHVYVECDDCGHGEEIALTATSHGYDERNVNADLRARGWLVDDGDFCEDCARKQAAEGAKTERGQPED